jgi:DNA-binding CsgD family transcriptional regulator
MTFSEASLIARDQLELARGTFERPRAHPWLSRVDAQVRKLTDAPASRGEMAGLTAKEYEVAQMAARGLTNKQIGAELFLSPRTVGTYLYRAYPKLGISTRAALRDALSGREPIADDSMNPPEWGKYVADHIPGAKYVELPGLACLA